jgi:GH35 family endo-1,4-beta-xylanase
MIQKALPEAKLRIGMQMHIDADDLPDEQDVINTVRRIKEYGVEIAFTEGDNNIG